MVNFAQVEVSPFTTMGGVFDACLTNQLTKKNQHLCMRMSTKNRERKRERELRKDIGSSPST